MKLLIAAVVTSICVNAQEPPVPRLKGLRVFGRTEADIPVVTSSNPITIEFDIEADSPPELHLRVIHCNKEWEVTETSFVNDEFRNRTRSELRFITAPVGIRSYDFHYTLQLPSEDLLARIPFSGNYLLEIRDRADGEQLLASARFFVSDEIVQPVLSVRNRLDPSSSFPLNQVHQMFIRFRVPEPDSAAVLPYFSHDFTCVDVYRNKEITRPWHISPNDRDMNTFVEGIATPLLIFRIDNIPAGNEYRVLNIEDENFYPQDRLVRARTGADIVRFPGKQGFDHNGGSTLVRGSRIAEYMEFRFELLTDPRSGPVFVVGDFNLWEPESGGPMLYSDGRYQWMATFRRGTYDYQYVEGDDWIALEGNDWRTTSRYTALVYYRDPRFGGFDRIVGTVQGLSPGGSGPTAH